MKRYFVRHNVFWQIKNRRVKFAMKCGWVADCRTRALARRLCGFLNRQDNEARGIGLYKKILKAAKRLPDLPICTVNGRRVPASWGSMGPAKKRRGRKAAVKE